MNTKLIEEAIQLGYEEPEIIVAWLRNARGARATIREVKQAIQKLGPANSRTGGKSRPKKEALTDDDVDQINSIALRVGTDSLRIILDIIDQNGVNTR